MARPSSRLGTSNHQYRRRYPTDIRRILDGLGGSFLASSGMGNRRANAKIAQSDLLARDLAEWAGKVVEVPGLGKVLHAIRHRFMTCCRHAGIEEQYVEVIAGHAPRSQNRQYGDFPLAALARELAKLESYIIEGASSPLW